MTVEGSEILSKAKTAAQYMTRQAKCVARVLSWFLKFARSVPKCMWGWLWKIERLLISRALQVTHVIAIRFSPIVFTLLVASLGLLVINARAPQAPAWIATSLAVVCSAAVSLLAMKKPIRKDLYYARVAAVFMLVPAAFGCWDTLRTEEFEERLSIVTAIIDWSKAEALGPNVINDLGDMLYMPKAAELINAKMDNSENKGLSIRDRQGRVKELAASANLVEFLLLDQLGLIFSRSWQIRLDKYTNFGGQELQITDLRGGKHGVTVLRKADLQKLLPGNALLKDLPDNFQIRLPPGMVVHSRLLQRWHGDTARALVFQDPYCKVEMMPIGGLFAPIAPMRDGQVLFVQKVDIAIKVEFVGWWVGTQ